MHGALLTAPRLTDLAPHTRLPALRWLLVLLVAVHAALNSAVLFPDLYALGVDESEFIQNARITAHAWLDGRPALPEYAYNPLGTLLYLLLYVPAAQSPDGFMLVLWAGRCLLFAGLWASALLIAWQLRAVVPPLVVAGLLFVLPIHQNLTSSEGLFAVLAGLAFWQLLKCLDDYAVRHAVLAGGFMGLAGLARNDGAVLLALATLLVLGVHVLHRKHLDGWRRRALRAVVALLLPGLAVLGGYWTLQGALAGEFDPSVGRRSYLAFEQGQGVAFSGQQQAWFSGVWEARQLYGTREENGHSVFRAIARNPRAFVKRAVQSLTQLPVLAILTYGGGTGVVALGLAGAGLLWLIRRRQWGLALLLGAWPLHLLIYVAFFYRPGYLFMPYFALVVLAAVGAWHSGGALTRAWGRPLAVLSCVIGAGLALLTGVGAFLSNGLAIAAGLIAVRWVAPVLRSRNLVPVGSALTVLAVLLLIRIPFQERVPQLGATGAEQSAAYLASAFPPDSPVAAFRREEVWMAKMTYVSLAIDATKLDAGQLQFRSAQELREWVRRSGVRAIYQSDVMRWLAPDMYRLIESGIGTDYREVFSITVLPPNLKRRFVDFDPNFTPDGRHRVLVPNF